MINKTTVKHFKFAKYLGTWYEIARFDHYAERDMEDITATYSMGHSGKIHVYNSGYRYNVLRKSTGKLKIPNFETPAKMKISFLYFFYADYWILELDKSYQWAVVGSSSDKYLWILSRKPTIEEKLYQKILRLIEKRGYPIDKLIRVKHNT